MAASNKDEAPEAEKVAMFPSYRLLLVFMIFLGNLFMFSARVNLSVAILCMVRNKSDNKTSPRNNDTDAYRDDAGSSHDYSKREHAEFDWDKKTIGELLAMYYYGYILTHVLGGWLASRYGGKRIWGGFQAVCVASTLLMPVGARTSVYLAYGLRFLLGFASGVTLPCMYSLLGRWAPPLERSKMASFAAAGTFGGSVFTLAVSGFLCEHGFDNGWASIFYLTGFFNLLWVFAWFWLVADSPEQHPCITRKERNYISNAIGKGNIDRIEPVPWCCMAKSGPVWAIIIAHFMSSYLGSTLLTFLPMFMEERLKFNIKENGVLSALPYFAQFIGTILVGQYSDFLIERRLMSTRNVRRLNETVGFLGSSACLIAVGFTDHGQRWIAVGLLCMCLFILSACMGGHGCNYLDLAPRYAGVMKGVANTIATIPAMVSPIIGTSQTLNGTPEEWRSVFYVCVGLAVLGAIVYPLLADGELQPWAVPLDNNNEVNVKVEKVKDGKNISTDNREIVSVINKGFNIDEVFQTRL